LRQEAHAEAVGQPSVALVLAVDAGHDPQERALPRPVRAEHADLGARVEREVDPFQDLALGAGHDLLQIAHREDELWRHVGPKRN